MPANSCDPICISGDPEWAPDPEVGNPYHNASLMSAAETPDMMDVTNLRSYSWPLCILNSDTHSL